MATHSGRRHRTVGPFTRASRLVGSVTSAVSKPVDAFTGSVGKVGGFLDQELERVTRNPKKLPIYSVSITQVKDVPTIGHGFVALKNARREAEKQNAQMILQVKDSNLRHVVYAIPSPSFSFQDLDAIMRRPGGGFRAHEINPRHDAFTSTYIEAALWSSMDGENKPLDSGDYELAPETMSRMEKDAAKFQEKYGDLISEGGRGNSQAGHDFWLTRNGHGAGFWDGDWPKEIGDKLTKAAKSFGEFDLYVGDDGLIYGSGGRTPNPAGGADLIIGPRKYHFDSTQEAYDHGVKQQNRGVHSNFTVLDLKTGEKYTYDRSGKGKMRNPVEVIQDGLEACDDCVQAIANDDYSGIESDKRERQIRRGIQSYAPGYLVVGEEIGFTHGGCDICGSSLGGNKHEVSVLGNTSGRQQNPASENPAWEHNLWEFIGVKTGALHKTSNEWPYIPGDDTLYNFAVKQMQVEAPEAWRNSTTKEKSEAIRLFKRGYKAGHKKPDIWLKSRGELQNPDHVHQNPRWWREELYETKSQGQRRVEQLTKAGYDAHGKMMPTSRLGDAAFHIVIRQGNTDDSELEHVPGVSSGGHSMFVGMRENPQPKDYRTEGNRIRREAGADWTSRRSEWANTASKYAKEVNDHVRQYWSIFNREYQKLHGRKPEAWDWKVSGVGDDRLPSHIKDELRNIVREIQTSRDYADAYWYAAFRTRFPGGGGAHYLSEYEVTSPATPRRRNPESESAEMYEKFHGTPSQGIVEVEEEEHYHGHLAELGVLVSLQVETVTGLTVQLDFTEDGEAGEVENPRQRTTTDEFIVQGNYGYGHGWEDLTAEDTRTEARERLKEYRENERGVPFRLITRRVKIEKPNPAEVDTTAARELEIFAENDAALYRSQLQPIQRNLITKMARGIYNHTAAVKLFGYLMESAAKKYVKEFGSRDDVWHEMFNTATRRAAAETFTDSFEVEAALGNYDNYLPKKYAGWSGKQWKGAKQNPGLGWTGARLKDDPGGWHVMRYGGGRYTSVSWHPTKAEAEAEVKKIMDRGAWSGMPPKIEKGRTPGHGWGKQNPSDAVSPSTVLLCSNETGDQLYLIGGDQSIDLSTIKMDSSPWLKDSMVIGDITIITYRTRKSFDNHEETDYFHHFSEEDAKKRKSDVILPQLIYDRMNETLAISGGRYFIKKPVFGVSPGIQN